MTWKFEVSNALKDVMLGGRGEHNIKEKKPYGTNTPQSFKMPDS